MTINPSTEIARSSPAIGLLDSLRYGGSAVPEDLISEGVACDQQGVLELAKGLMKAGVPVYLGSWTASTWEEFAVEEFTIGLASNPNLLLETLQLVGAHIADMEAVKAGMLRAVGGLAEQDAPQPRKSSQTIKEVEL